MTNMHLEANMYCLLHMSMLYNLHCSDSYRSCVSCNPYCTARYNAYSNCKWNTQTPTLFINVQAVTDSSASGVKTSGASPT